MLDVINVYNVLSNTSISNSSSYCRNLHMSGIVPKYEDILSYGYTKFIKANDVVVDVGVNHGFHFERLAALVGEGGSVVGFEPVPDFLNLVKSKNAPDIDIRQKALSTAPGRASFLHMTKAAGESGFIERTNPMDRGAVQIDVEVSTLDIEMSAVSRLDYIKIDVEGHEISVLNGGREVIAKHKPIISIEYGSPTYTLYGLTAHSIVEWASDNGYVVSDLWGNLLQADEAWETICDASYWDYYLVPLEKTEFWKDTWAQD